MIKFSSVREYGVNPPALAEGELVGQSIYFLRAIGWLVI